MLLACTLVLGLLSGGSGMASTATSSGARDDSQSWLPTLGGAAQQVWDTVSNIGQTVSKNISETAYLWMSGTEEEDGAALQSNRHQQHSLPTSHGSSSSGQPPPDEPGTSYTGSVRVNDTRLVQRRQARNHPQNTKKMD